MEMDVETVQFRRRFRSIGAKPDRSDRIGFRFWIRKRRFPIVQSRRLTV